jgi:hypothetical protein
VFAFQLYTLNPQIMKKFIYLIFVVFVATLSCTKADFYVPVKDFDDHRMTLTTRRDSNRVSLSDIYDVIERDFPKTKGSNAVNDFEVTSYVRNRADTLMYIVNSGGNGWKIYSSDKRTPAILAEGDKGYFSLEEGSPSVAVWLDCLASDMERVLRSSDEELIFSKEDIQANKVFWMGSLEPAENTRSKWDSLLKPLPNGHWEQELISSTVEYEEVDHMAPKWHQRSPYNQCCPYYVNEPTKKALAGCVAVAGAQLLYCLNEKIGAPMTMYSEGVCVGDVSNYQKYFSGESATVWNEMSAECISSVNYLNSEDVLISYVGTLVNMHYCEDAPGDYSWALPRNIKDNILDVYGISSSRGSYDEDIVRESLLNNMPVVVSATDLLIPADFDIHCFVIDGYRKERTKYTYNNYFVIDDTIIASDIIPIPYISYSYSTPQITAIKINWGWSTQWNEYTPFNDGWYTLTGGWTVDDGNDIYDYNYNRTIIYGFEAPEV